MLNFKQLFETRDEERERGSPVNLFFKNKFILSVQFFFCVNILCLILLFVSFKLNEISILRKKNNEFYYYVSIFLFIINLFTKTISHIIIFDFNKI